MSIEIVNKTNFPNRNSNHILDSNTIFGFWIYMMSDCIIFATLFATYVVMIHNKANSLLCKEIFKLPFVLGETACLLISSFTYGMAFLSMHANKKKNVNIWLMITSILGLIFVFMELYEFHSLIKEHYSPNQSGFLSSFFTLVGTHGLHVISGIIWMLILMIHISKHGLTSNNCTRIVCLSLFWHFLDIIWICLFTVVYLMGVI